MLSLYASHDRLHLSHDVQFRSMPKTDMSVSFSTVLPFLSLSLIHFHYSSTFRISFCFRSDFLFHLSPPRSTSPERSLRSLSFSFHTFFFVLLFHSFAFVPVIFHSFVPLRNMFPNFDNVQVVTSFVAERIIILKLMK